LRPERQTIEEPLNFADHAAAHFGGGMLARPLIPTISSPASRWISPNTLTVWLIGSTWVIAAGPATSEAAGYAAATAAIGRSDGAARPCDRHIRILMCKNRRFAAEPSKWQTSRDFGPSVSSLQTIAGDAILARPPGPHHATRCMVQISRSLLMQ
jgi:hypothetical protein